MDSESSAAKHYDVAIIGGALSGAAAALLLLRAHPKLRVLIIEKSTAFTRRVGEATVEVSAYFLSRVLGLTQYLNEAHGAELALVRQLQAQIAMTPSGSYGRGL